MLDELSWIILGLIIAIIILNIQIPHKAKLDWGGVEFRYYYSSCLNKSFSEKYMERFERLIRMFDDSSYNIIELDENC